MAPPFVVPNGCQVKLYWSLSGALGVNAFGAIVQGATTINQALANTVGAAIKSSFTTLMATHYGTDVILSRVALRDVRSANLAEFRDAGATVPGSGVGDSLPRAVAFCVTLRTAQAGKRFRGRVYLPAPLETINGPTGNASTTYQTAAINFVTAVSTALTSNGLQLAVLGRPEESRTITRTINARAAMATAVTAIESRNLAWESQRRRGNFVGSAVTAYGLTDNVYQDLSAPEVASPPPATRSR